MSSTTTATQEGAASENAGRISKTIGYYLAFITLGVTMAALGPTLPGLAAHTQTRLNEISFLFTAKGLGYLLGSLQAGRLFDRMPGHPLIVGGLLIVGAMLALTPLTPWIWLLAAIVLVLGIAEGIVDAGTNTLLVWVHHRNVGPFMNGLHFFFGVGAFVAPLIIAQMMEWSGDINWGYWVLALLVLPAALWISRLPSPAHAAADRGTTVVRINRRIVALVALFFFLYVGAEGSFGGWIYTYATTLKLSDTVTAALLTSAFWGALTAGRLLAVPLATRFSPQSILITDLAGCLVGVGLVLLRPDSILAVWAGTLATGLAMASIFPTTLAFAERRMTITASASSWFFVGSGAGGMIIPWLIGQLFVSIGPYATMFTIMACLLLMVFVLAALLAPSKHSATSA